MSSSTLGFKTESIPKEEKLAPSIRNVNHDVIIPSNILAKSASTKITGSAGTTTCHIKLEKDKIVQYTTDVSKWSVRALDGVYGRLELDFNMPATWSLPPFPLYQTEQDLLAPTVIKFPLSITRRDLGWMSDTEPSIGTSPSHLNAFYGATYPTSIVNWDFTKGTLDMGLMTPGARKMENLEAITKRKFYHRELQDTRQTIEHDIEAIWYDLAIWNDHSIVKWATKKLAANSQGIKQSIGNTIIGDSFVVNEKFVFEACPKTHTTFSPYLPYLPQTIVKKEPGSTEESISAQLSGTLVLGGSQSTTVERGQSTNHVSQQADELMKEIKQLRQEVQASEWKLRETESLRCRLKASISSVSDGEGAEKKSCFLKAATEESHRLGETVASIRTENEQRQWKLGQLEKHLQVYQN